MLITFTSAKGSPGVTTAATALAMVWQRDVVLADFDPIGGDVALRSRTPDNDILDPDLGLLSLAASARRGLAAEDIEEHLQIIDGGTRVLAGVTHPEQLTGIGGVWPTIVSGLKQVPDADVLVDAGRVSPGSPVLPAVTGADAVVMVVRPSLDAYAHLRDRLRWLAGPLDIGRAGSVPVGVLLVTEPGDTSSGKQLDRLLQHEQLQVSVLGRIAIDPKAAAALSGEWTRRLDRSLLLRSAREVAGSLRDLTSSRPSTADLSKR